MPLKDLEARKEYHKQWRLSNKDKWASYHKSWRERNPEKHKNNRPKSKEAALLFSTRSRARRSGIPFDLTIEDINIPEYCPVFGTKLNSGSHDSKASIDKIIPEKGYVRGNICIISLRANRIKNNATLTELVQLSEYAKRFL